MSRTAPRRTSALVSANLFDMKLRAMRRHRAFRTGPATFLYERAFEDVLERLGSVNRRLESVLLVGVPVADWPQRLRDVATSVTCIDPGAGFAKAAGGLQAIEDQLDVRPGSFDLCVAIGTLDTVNDLAGALLRLRLSLKPDSLLIGAMSGGDTLPRLRHAMRAADSVTGGASPHVHPRIDAPALAQLLAAAGFDMPVIDIDRVRVAYRSLRKLIGDLRAMGATNVLTSRSRSPLTRNALAAAEKAFGREADQSRTTETFELLHFAAWTPPAAAARG